jgi:hypothetical protein
MGDALRAVRQVGDVLFRSANLCSAAQVLAGLGRPIVAATLLGFAMARFGELGTRERWVELMNEETMASIRRQLDGPAIDAAAERGRRLNWDEATQLAVTALDAWDVSIDPGGAASEWVS